MAELAERDPRSYLDPKVLDSIKKLELRARLVVEGFVSGMHESPYRGFSVEFAQHREYVPGDDIRFVDWKVYAKSDRIYIKEFEEETNLRSYLLVDGSGSMGYGQSTLSKFDYARYLASALGYLLVGQRDAVGLMTFDTQVRERIEPSTNPLNYRRIVDALQRWKPGSETSLARVFSQLIPTLKRRSLVILVSDFFDEIAPLREALKQFRHDRHEVILFQVVAPEEEEFPFSRPTQFRSLEKSGHRILVDPHRLRSIYLEQYAKFTRDLEQTCGNLGIDLIRLVTSQPYHQALGAYLNARARRKGKV
ncbi:MAG: DUF58 domain-containing protein [Planctomycetaceae bacterium]|nr:DUF58 domain-containing protein [Planctomycetaceae bacterium]